VDVIKIDRSFVGDMAISGDAGTIVRATINLAHDLGLEVVAEGVEDRQTCGVLHEMGCDLVQGYYLNRPLPGPELTDWLRERERATVEQSTRTVPRFTLVKRQTDRGA
jgi:EAL domain-containing protein (putative c-di-GMP-specific phosphodiesterase class I)